MAVNLTPPDPQSLLAVQGVFTGLATLVWLLVASRPDVADEAEVVASESE